MLVCNVSLRPQSATLAADIVEAGAALDVTDFVTLFGPLVDSPGNATDTVNAVVGQFMVESASAADVVTVGMAYRITILEDTTAIANNLAVIAPKHVVTATITEAATATATQSVIVATYVALYETAHVASTATSTLLGTEAPDSGPATVFKP
jgi:hypothetical protein